MKRNYGSKRRQAGLSTAILIGFLASVMVLLLGGVALSALVVNGTIDEIIISYMTPLILLLSAILGAYISARGVDDDKLIACAGVCGVIIFLLITITILFFGGEFKSVIPSLLTILLGGAAAFGLNLYKTKSQYRRKR